MNLIKIFLLVFIFINGHLQAEQNDDPAAILSSYLKKLDSFSANFQQHSVSSSQSLIDTISGKFLMKRPNRFRWEILSPYEQLIIADGKSLWSIDTDLEQVTVADLEESMINSPMMLLSQDNNQLEKLFSIVISAADDDMEMQRFILSPIDGSANFEKIQLGFNEGILQLIELHDSLGQITIVKMLNIRNNPIIGNDSFTFEKIPGFDFIDSRTQESESDRN